MSVAFKIANSIRAKTLQRLFFGKEFDGQELLLHTNVSWLNSSKFLHRFLDLLREIKAYFQDTGYDYAKLDDLVWLSGLAFQADRYLFGTTL